MNGIGNMMLILLMKYLGSTNINAAVTYDNKPQSTHPGVKPSVPSSHTKPRVCGHTALNTPALVTCSIDIGLSPPEESFDPFFFLSQRKYTKILCLLLTVSGPLSNFFLRRKGEHLKLPIASP